MPSTESGVRSARIFLFHGRDLAERWQEFIATGLPALAMLDEAEAQFPFEGLIEFEDVETSDRLVLDAKGMRGDYLQAIRAFQEYYRCECAKANIDYVPIDTSVSFDRALLEYLVQRQRRF